MAKSHTGNRFPWPQMPRLRGRAIIGFVMWKPLDYRRCTFAELSASELYEILALRAEVFVVEQECAYQDVDGVDQRSVHLQGRRDGKLLAYARWFESDGGWQIGRIVTSPTGRRQGLGRALLDQALEAIPRGHVHMEAQTYLVDFYRGFGFETDGPEFLEDGIPHIRMVRTITP
jgi:ElaA protein